MRAELEVDLAHPRGSDPSATHRSVLDEAIGMEHLVDDLLELARSDTGRIGRADSVDLDDIVLTEAGRLRAAGRRAVVTTGVRAVQVVGDARQLARAVRNLADNAERHALGTVSFASAEADGQAILTVSDDGPGVPLDQRRRIFERFARLDEARTATSGGTGLGLAITLAIAEAHGGTARVESAESGGARFVMTLPIAPGHVDDPR